MRSCDQVLQIPKRKRQIVKVSAPEGTENVHFAFSSKHGSLGLRIVFVASSALEQPKANEGTVSNTSFFSDLEKLTSNCTFECNYFCSKVIYYTFHCLDTAKESADLLQNAEPDALLIEILPLTRYPSNQMTIRGRVHFPLPGDYLFVFDNSFSITTSKPLLFCHQLNVSEDERLSFPSGWIYKRDGKAFKRRWFFLNLTQGTLNWSNSFTSVHYKTLALHNSHVLLNSAKLELLLKVGPASMRLQTKRLAEIRFWSDLLQQATQQKILSIQATVYEPSLQSEGISFISSLASCDGVEGSETFFDALEDEKETEELIENEMDASVDSRESFSKNAHSRESCSQNAHPTESHSEIVSTQLHKNPSQEYFSAQTPPSLSQKLSTALTLTQPTTSRNALPVPMQPLELRITDILRNPKGALPLTFNEPLTLLQKLCEDLEYAHSLLQSPSTNHLQNDHEFTRVCAFALSGYASNKHRDRKPFNPILGETFQHEWNGIRFFAEKVSHNPLVVACHAEGKNFEYWNSLQVSFQMRGLSVEVCFEGNCWLRLFDRENSEGEKNAQTSPPSHSRLYHWNKASTQIKCSLSNQKTIEITGKVQIHQPHSQNHAEIRMKGTSFFSKSNFHALEGHLTIASNNAPQPKTCTIAGTWDHSIQCDGIPIFVANQLPPNSHQYYGFSHFALNLNCISSAAKASQVPSTDSRNRPDIRAYEHGHTAEAQCLKNKLEERQREARKGPPFTPKWFTFNNETAEWTCKRSPLNNQPLYWTDRTSPEQ